MLQTAGYIPDCANIFLKCICKVPGAEAASLSGKRTTVKYDILLNTYIYIISMLCWY